MMIGAPQPAAVAGGKTWRAAFQEVHSDRHRASRMTVEIVALVAISAPASRRCSAASMAMASRAGGLGQHRQEQGTRIPPMAPRLIRTRHRWISTARSAPCAPSSRSGPTRSWSTKVPTRRSARGVIDIYAAPAARCRNLGVMGIGMGFAIAAAVETGKPVLAVEGDPPSASRHGGRDDLCYGLPVCVVISTTTASIAAPTPMRRADPRPPFAAHAIDDGRFGGVGVNGPRPMSQRAPRCALIPGSLSSMRSTWRLAAKAPHRQPQSAKRPSQEIRQGTIQ